MMPSFLALTVDGDTPISKVLFAIRGMSVVRILSSSVLIAATAPRGNAILKYI